MRQHRLASRLLCLALLLPAPLLVCAQPAHSADPVEPDSQLGNAYRPSAEQPLDLARYMGRWYVIGRIANPVERGHVASMHEYRADEDGEGKVRIDYYFRDHLDGPLQVMNLRARADADSGNQRWRTWFYKVIPTRTEILEVAEDYSWVLIGYRGRDMAWIMARDAQMSHDDYFQLSQRLAGHGVNTDRMRRVLHSPEQRGRLGFEVAGKR